MKLLDKVNDKMNIIKKSVYSLNKDSEFNELYSVLIENSLNEIYVFSAINWKFIKVNYGAVNNLGYSKSELLEMTPLNLKPEFNSATFNALIIPLIKKEKNELVFETIHKRKNGSEYPVEVHLQYFEYFKEPVFLAIIKDLTERKISEQKLSEFAFRIDRIINHLPEGIVYISSSNKIEFVNQTFCRQFGLDEAPKNIIGQDAKDTLSKILACYAEPNLVAKMLIDIVAEFKPVYNKEILFADGRIFQFDFIPIYLNGVKHGRLWIHKDITEEKNNQEKLKNSEYKYRTLHESMIDGFVAVDMNGKFVDCNSIYSDMVGYSLDELLDLTYKDITPEKWYPFEAKIVEEQILVNGYSDIYEKEYRKKDGTIFPVELHTVLLKDEKGKPYLMWAIVRDISERKKNEQSLINSALYWQTTFDSVKDGICLLDTNQKIIKCNSAMSAYFNKEVKDIINNYCHEIVHNTSCPINNCPISKSFKSLKRESEELHFNNLWYNVIVDPIISDEGNVAGFVHSLVNITEKKLKEEELKKGYSILSGIMSSIKYPIFALDTNYCYLAFNQKHAEVMKALYGTEIRIGSNIFDFQTNESDRKLAKYNIDRALKGEMVFIESYSGDDYKSRLYFEVTHNPIFEDDKVIGVTVLARDITKRKRIDDELRELNNNLEKLVQDRSAEIIKYKNFIEETGMIARVGGWEYDLSSNQLTWTKETKIIYEVDEEYQPFLDLATSFYAPEAVSTISSSFKLLLEQGVCFDLELPFITAKGNNLFVRTIGQAYYKDNKIYKIAGTFQDITQRKLSEIKVKEYQENLEKIVQQRTMDLDTVVEELKRSNKELEQFAYVASHDLQEPLRMISSFTQLLYNRYKNKLDSDADDFINFIVDGANRMQQLINDLLDYSRVTSKGKPFEKINLQLALDNSIYNLMSKIESSNAVINCTPLPLVLGDVSQITRLFQNILDNAIKYRSEKQLEINISSYLIDNMNIIQIKDNGIGFNMKFRNRIFEIFERLHSNVGSGTGIGLAVCKRIVERHGGQIWAESSEGEGTTFYFSLPLAK